MKQFLTYPVVQINLINIVFKSPKLISNINAQRDLTKLQ